MVVTVNQWKGLGGGGNRNNRNANNNASALARKGAGALSITYPVKGVTVSNEKIFSPMTCPVCATKLRRRSVGCDDGYERMSCECWVPLIACWRELLAVHDRVMQQPRRES